MLLLAIAVAAFASTLAGGLLALGLRDKLHLILGFSAGAVIGVAFFDLLPEAIDTARGFHSAAVILAWSALGFLSYLVLDRMLLIHADGPPRGSAGALVLCAHSLLDGVAIGFAFQGSRAVGLIVAAAVLTHDFSDGVNTMNIVLRNGGERARALRWLLIDAAAPAAGIAATRLWAMPADRERSDSRELPRPSEAPHDRDDARRRSAALPRRSPHRIDITPWAGPRGGS
jgi:zinc transporter ZupT